MQALNAGAMATLGAGGLAGSFRLPVLPWAVAAADDRRFRGILQFCLMAAVTLAVALRLITLQPVDRQTAQALPPPMARLILERPVLPPPPPAPTRDRSPTESAAPEPSRAEASAPTPPRRNAPPPPTARQPIEGRAPGELALEQARRKAAGSGLLALKNEISAMSAAPAAAQLQEPLRPAPGVGTTAGAGAGAGSEAGDPARALVTASAGRSSGGIGNAAYSRDSGGGGLAGRATTLVSGGGGLGSGGGGAGGATGSKGTGSGAAEAAAGTKPGATVARGSGRAARSIEDIKLVFERQKGAIYALYNRALRDDPSLQGKVVIELKIAPGGTVEAVRIVSSELKSEELERKLLARIRSFDFGAKDVDTLVLTWPVDFLPS